VSRARAVLLVLGVAAAVHVAFLFALPRLIVAYVIRELSAEVGLNAIVHRPLATSDWRSVPMPSPDLLYSACAFDVSQRPMVITAEVPDSYWSVSAYASNTDNFFVLNDRKAGAKPVRVVLSGDPEFVDAQGGLVVHAPTTRGVVLFRTLVRTKADVAAMEASQHAAHCTPL
jgi:uncharacterized membrane protein